MFSAVEVSVDPIADSGCRYFNTCDKTIFVVSGVDFVSELSFVFTLDEHTSIWVSGGGGFLYSWWCCAVIIIVVNVLLYSASCSALTSFHSCPAEILAVVSRVYYSKKTSLLARFF